jgi:ABC-type spermidine/putrescine transport system permease subunit I
MRRDVRPVNNPERHDMNQYHQVFGEFFDAIWRGVTVGITIAIACLIIAATLFCFVRITPKVLPSPVECEVAQ